MKKLQVKVKFYIKAYEHSWAHDDNTHYIGIKLKFKEEGKLFNTRLEGQLEFNKNNKESVNDAINFLSIEEEQVVMITEYIEKYFAKKRFRKVADTDLDVIIELVGRNNKKTLEIKIDE